MFNKFILIFFLILLCLVLLLVNSNLFPNLEVTNILNEIDVSDSESLNLKEIYLTIIKNKTTNYVNSFDELKNAVNDNLYMKILFQEGKNGSVKTGDYGYSLNDANGILNLNKKYYQAQDSYKIKLDKSIGLWQEMDEFYLNKYSNDNLKVRVKLSSDLFKIVSDYPSPETELIHLYIKENSALNYQRKFIDYGLYTLLEDIDKDFLVKNNLDLKGWLYEAKNFEFFQYQDSLKTLDNKLYSKKEIEKILEIKGNEEHSNIIDMLSSLNNTDIPINQIIAEFFDEENYLTWLAFNILTGNTESKNSDFYLYSKTDSNRWYFIVGDYASSFGGSILTPWQDGISNYWGSQLHNRYLQVEENRNKLTARIEELSFVLSNDLLLSLLDSYKPLISNILTREPDSLTSINSRELIDKEFNYLSQEIERNKARYYLSLKKPMPVNMLRPQNYGEYVLFKWSDSFDFQEEIIQYTLDISTSPEFKNIVFHSEEIIDNEQLPHLSVQSYQRSFQQVDAAKEWGIMDYPQPLLWH